MILGVRRAPSVGTGRRAAVLAAAGCPGARRSCPRTSAPAPMRRAELFAEHVAAGRGPRWKPSAAEFAAVYRGEGRNAPGSPLAEILRRAERLALFAVTLGEADQPGASQRCLAARGLRAGVHAGRDGVGRGGRGRRPGRAPVRRRPARAGPGHARRRGAALQPRLLRLAHDRAAEALRRLRPERIGIVAEGELPDAAAEVGVGRDGRRAARRSTGSRTTTDFCDRLPRRATCRDRLRALFTHEHA